MKKDKKEKKEKKGKKAEKEKDRDATPPRQTPPLTQGKVTKKQLMEQRVAMAQQMLVDHSC